jgi:predicted phosphodiesterase
MNLAFLHLSDLHIKDSDSDLIKLAPLVSRAFLAHHNDASSFIVLVSGDIAYSGNKEEYDIARTFFTSLLNLISSDTPKIDPKIVIVPGNHDCNFKLDNDARKTIITSCSLPNPAIDDRTILLCTETQSSFFEFSECFDSSTVSSNKLFWYVSLTVGDMKVLIRCFNSSWSSSIHEKLGSLYFPVDLMRSDNAKYDLIVSVLHHPYVWYSKNCYKYFREYLEKESDVIITGHEHDPQFSEVIRLKGLTTDYFEGGAFRCDIDGWSEFSSFSIDLGNKIKNLFRYSLEGDYYSLSERIEDIPFVRSINLIKDFESLNSSFEKELEDPGAGFNHPKVGQPKLSDIFIMPTLELRDIAKGKRKRVHIQLDNDNALNFLLDTDFVILSGNEKYGKSSISKMLFKALHKKGIVPVLLKIERDLKITDIDRLVKHYFNQQYSKEYYEKFLQLDKSKKALIIDDFHKIRLNKKGRIAFLQSLTNKFNKVIVVSDDIFVTTDILESDLREELLKIFTQCSIMGFGFRLKEKLARKWYELGQEKTIREEELIQKIDQAVRMFDTVMTEGLIPSVPIYILTILQMLETGYDQGGFSKGAFGHLYEYLITQKLYTTTKNPKEINNKYSLLSNLAYSMFKNSLFEITFDEYDRINNEYKESHLLDFSNKKMLEDLITDEMLEEESGNISFKYKYILHYFVGRFIAENIENPKHADEIKELISIMCQETYREDYADILTFIIYRNVHEFVINKMLSESKKIYETEDRFDFHVDGQRISNKTNWLLDFSIPTLPTIETRETVQRERDISEAKRRELTKRIQESEMGEDELREFYMVNRAVKSLRILGQILTEFPGDVDAMQKIELAKEIYAIGLRTLKKLTKYFEENVTDFIESIKRIAEARHGIVDEQKKTQFALDYYNWNIHALAISTVIRISDAVGSYDLKHLYPIVKKEYSEITGEIIDLEIRLDHFPGVPVDEIIRFRRTLRKNRLTADVLRGLVHKYLHMFYCKESTKQKLCDNLKIGVRKNRLLSVRHKRRK